MLHYSIAPASRFTTVYRDERPVGTITAPLVRPRPDVSLSDHWTISDTEGRLLWSRKYRPPFYIIKALLG